MNQLKKLTRTQILPPPEAIVMSSINHKINVFIPQFQSFQFTRSCAYTLKLCLVFSLFSSRSLLHSFTQSVDMPWVWFRLSVHIISNSFNNSYVQKLCAETANKQINQPQYHKHHHYYRHHTTFRLHTICVTICCNSIL